MLLQLLFQLLFFLKFLFFLHLTCFMLFWLLSNVGSNPHLWVGAEVRLANNAHKVFYLLISEKQAADGFLPL